LFAMWATTISFFSTALFFLPFVVHAEDGGCPSIQPRKHVVCYYDGKRPVSSLNVCLCTHLIYTSIGLDEFGRLDLSKDVISDISALRKQNSRLRIVVSLGGEAVKGSTFSSLITDNESLTNLTSSISAFHNNDVIDGLEIDWEWPVRDGGKKDRMKLIRYTRQIKLAVGEEVVLRGHRNQRSINNHRIVKRIKRESPIDDEEEGKDIEDDIIEANEEEERYFQTYKYNFIKITYLKLVFKFPL
jgi:GH18 family chitinase